MGYKIVTQPTVEPVSLAEAKLNMRVDDDQDSPASHPDDQKIEALIVAARQYAEGFTGRALAPQTIELAFDDFPCDEIELIKPPAIEISSVAYVDEDGADQVLSSLLYSLDNYSEPNWLLPAEDTEWPDTRGVVNGVKITYTAGYSARTDVAPTNPIPEAIRQAIKLIVAHWYANVEDATPVKLETIPLGAQVLLRNYRILKGFA